MTAPQRRMKLAGVVIRTTDHRVTREWDAETHRYIKTLETPSTRAHSQANGSK